MTQIILLFDMSNKKSTIVQEKFEWDSDNDDFHDHEDVVEACHHQNFEFSILGFHPYKDILFLCRLENFEPRPTGFAYHLNIFKVERLGGIDPTDYEYYACGLFDDSNIESFPYKPCCWIKDIP
jgi:hypothetical protein